MVDLWERLGPLFNDPDGSLPEISIGNLTAHEVPVVVGLLESHAAEVRNGVTWTPSAGAVLEVPVAVADLKVAAGEVAGGRHEPFHVVLTNLTRATTKVPDLGIFIFEDEVAIDYEPGAAWTAQALQALFELLCDLRRAAPGCLVEYERHASEQWRRAFAAAVAQYCDRAPAG